MWAINWLVSDRAVQGCVHSRTIFPRFRPPAARPSMSQEINLGGKDQYSHTIDRSTPRDLSVSYPPKGKVDIYCEFTAGPHPPSETVHHLHVQDDFPDGGLRAWLVVLGVRYLLFSISHWVVDEQFFSVHVRLSQREPLHAVVLL